MTEESAVDTATREALQDLLTEFARLADNGCGDRLHELFTEDGTITGPGLAMRGRAEIAQQFAARAGDPRRLSRHCWSNPRFERVDEDTVRVTTVVQTYMLMCEEGEEPPVDRYTHVVGDSTDVMRRCEDGCWRFASRELLVVFRSEP